MNFSAAIPVNAVQVAKLHPDGETMPVYVHIIDHPDARVLVDTGMTQLHPAVADMDPHLYPWQEQDFDIGSVDIVVNTHLHFDHCGGNHLFAGKPVYVQRQELDDARNQDDYSIPEWVDPRGMHYVPVDGAFELLAGIRLLPAPGHTRGSQIVVIDGDQGPTVVAGDTAVRFADLENPKTEGQLLIRSLNPEMVWLTHENKPWNPEPVSAAWGAEQPANPTPFPGSSRREGA